MVFRWVNIVSIYPIIAQLLDTNPSFALLHISCLIKCHRSKLVYNMIGYCKHAVRWCYHIITYALLFYLHVRLLIWFFYNIRTLNSLSICSWSTYSSRIAAVVVQQQEDWYQKVGVHCCTLLWRSCRWSSCTGGSARVLDVLSFDSCRLILLSFCSTKKHLPVPSLDRCPVVNLSTQCSNLSLISIYCYLLVPTNIVPSFLQDPIQLEEVVREHVTPRVF